MDSFSSFYVGQLQFGSLLLYGLILLLFNLYFRWKWIFLNPEFEGSIYKTLNNVTPEAWDLIVMNMSTISKGLFRTSVENQLGASMFHRPLPFIAKRYVFTRLTQSLKGKSEVIAATSIVTGVGIVGYT